MGLGSLLDSCLDGILGALKLLKRLFDCFAALENSWAKKTG
jgi:hypothetical protein